MHLGATFLVFTLVALLGPVLLQVNNILWETGFSSLTEHCLWSSFHLANFCSWSWTKSGKLNLFQVALLKIELFPSEGRRKPSCPSDHIWAKWPAGLGGTWVLPWGSRWEIFFHDFVQCLYVVMGLLQCVLGTQMAKQKLKVWPCFTVSLGFCSSLLVGLYPVSFLWQSWLFLSVMLQQPLSILILHCRSDSPGVLQIFRTYPCCRQFFLCSLQSWLLFKAFTEF